MQPPFSSNLTLIPFYSPPKFHHSPRYFGQFTLAINLPNHTLFWMWEETGASVKYSKSHRENIETPNRQHARSGLNPNHRSHEAAAAITLPLCHKPLVFTLGSINLLPCCYCIVTWLIFVLWRKCRMWLWCSDAIEGSVSLRVLNCLFIRNIHCGPFCFTCS